MSKKTLIIIIGLTVVLCGPVELRATLSSGELVKLADQAGLLFRQANQSSTKNAEAAKKLYDEAILCYRRIIDEGGIANASLYYNIGNAYLLKGDLGHAIVNYRRAEKLLGSNLELAANLKKNLATALAKRRDQIPLKAQKQVLRTLFFWHFDFSTKTRFLLGILFWAFGCIFATLRLLKRCRVLFITSIVFLVLCLSMIVSVAIDVHEAKSNLRGVIIAAEVTARQGDGENYPASFTEPLHCGTEFELREKRTRWLHIELGNGQDTWIPASAAEII